MPHAAYLTRSPTARERDRRSRLLVRFNFVFIDGKMRGLFSFLFGASMLLVIERREARANRGGGPFPPMRCCCCSATSISTSSGTATSSPVMRCRGGRLVLPRLADRRRWSLGLVPRSRPVPMMPGLAASSRARRRRAAPAQRRSARAWADMGAAYRRPDRAELEAGACARYRGAWFGMSAGKLTDAPPSPVQLQHVRLGDVGARCCSAWPRSGRLPDRRMGRARLPQASH